MYFVPEQAIPDLITPVEAFDTVERVFACLHDGAARNFPVLREALGYQGAIFGIKAGFNETGQTLGLKAGGYWPLNRHGENACHQSSILLFDPENGQAKALLGGNYLTALRTAAASAVSVKHLARSDAAVLGVIGAGAQVAHQVRAICRVRPIERVLIWNRTAERVNDVAASLTDIGVPVGYADRPEIGKLSDIVLTITSSTAPLYHAEWVRPGMHLACMGTDTRGKQEVAAEILGFASLFTDDIGQAVSIGECQHAIGKGGVGADIATLGAVVAGQHPGRPNDDAITLFDGTGFALQDIAIAEFVLQRALAARCAVEIETGRRIRKRSQTDA